MDTVIKKSFTEAITIIKNSEESIINKIPKDFINILDQNKDPDYHINVNEIDVENDLLPETYSILGLIYRDFLVSKEERAKLIENEKSIIKKYQESLREKYNTDTLFKKNKDKQPTINESTQSSMTIPQKSLFKKILEHIFRKKDNH